MRIVGVKFRNKGRIYHYFTDLPLEIGTSYDIVADGTQTYNSFVTVIEDNVCAADAYPNLRVITSAEESNYEER